MRTNKAFAALCSALFAGSLVLVPAVTSQAAATPKPIQTTAERNVVTDAFQDGYRQGYRLGYGDARDDCKLSRGGYGGYQQQQSQQGRWAQGFSSGYSRGFDKAEDRYC